MISKSDNSERESHSKVITEIHNALTRENFDKVLEIVSKIGLGAELDDVSQIFLLTYHYNFKSRFLERADFKYCMRFADILNKRVG